MCWCRDCAKWCMEFLKSYLLCYYTQNDFFVVMVWCVQQKKKSEKMIVKSVPKKIIKILNLKPNSCTISFASLDPRFYSLNMIAHRSAFWIAFCPSNTLIFD